MSTGEITVHVQEVHPCGEVHEIIYHMQDAVATVSTKFPDFSDIHKAFSIPGDAERVLEFKGSYNKVELKGMEFKDCQVTCAGCGMDLLFGPVAEGESEHNL